MEPALFQYDDIQIVINRSVPNLLPEAEERNNGFDQSQDEVDVAQGDEAPDPPLEDDPEHQEDAAGKRNLTGPWMLLEEHQRGQQLRQSVHGQEGESGRDEILEQEVRPGHLGAQRSSIDANRLKEPDVQE